MLACARGWVYREEKIPSFSQGSPKQVRGISGIYRTDRPVGGVDSVGNAALHLTAALQGPALGYPGSLGFGLGIRKEYSDPSPVSDLVGRGDPGLFLVLGFHSALLMAVPLITAPNGYPLVSTE